MFKLSWPVLEEGQIEPYGAKIGEERLCSHHNNTGIIQKKTLWAVQNKDMAQNAVPLQIQFRII